MKPIFWIPIFAIVGGVIGYAISRSTGWFSTTIGVVIGALIGTIIYSMLTRKKNRPE
jgi:uncharacterized membrane protein YeaQ/YmgE (transglycosylase-associated protein family)